jgi:parvulin-like peptidyl-prolyl isomerase
MVPPLQRVGSARDEEDCEGMRLSKRTNTIILWVISIGLLVGMIITFTPSLGLGGHSAAEGRPALFVNGEAISELEVARTRQNPLFSSVREGQVGEDLDLLLIDQLIRQKVFEQAAAKTRVSGREVRQEVQDFRESQGVAGRRNDRAYVQLIGQSGFDDQSFREYVESTLRAQKYEESLAEDLEVSQAEVETYYLANSERYRSEDRIRARMIVVDDVELANELRRMIQDGQSFAAVAAEHSLDRAEQQGALGAPRGSTEPQPVGRSALPTAVANAAFGLRRPGLTAVIESSERAYLVQVEEYLPSEPRPLAEVGDEVSSDALAAKRAGVVQGHVEELKGRADVRIPEGSELQYDDYVVARVGDQEIKASELVLATYSNQQIQQNLSPQLAPLIVEFFKPTILENMIERELAFVGSAGLDAEFVGTEAQVAQQALAYVSRDATVDEAAIEEYYEANSASFSVPAQAEVTRVDFPSQESAETYRNALLGGAEVEAAAQETGGTVADLGTVGEGELEEALDRALFATDAFEALPDGESDVSDVLVLQATDTGAEKPETGEDEAAGAQEGQSVAEVFVVLVAERTPRSVLPLEDVRDQVEAAVLAAERDELERAWIAQLREEIVVENLLAEINARESATEGGAGGDAAATDDPAMTEESADDAAGEGGHQE